MSDEEFLREILSNIDPTKNQVDSLLRLRNRVRSCIIDGIGGHPSLFMAGSFKKKTMIKQHYDLDMFIIWPPDFSSLKNLFYEVGNVLKSKWTKIERKKVGWRIPYGNEFHVDIIPSVQDKYNPGFSILYNCYLKEKLKTSMSVHVEQIEKYDRINVIKLLKLWKFRRRVPIKTFLLEIMTHLACYNLQQESLSIQLETVLLYIARNIGQHEFYDPANHENIITEDLTHPEKEEIRKKAYNAYNRNYWGEIFRNIDKE